VKLDGLGLGTAPLGGLYDAVDDETAHATVESAWSLGLRFFDTAPYYGSGLAERRLGAVLRAHPREELTVSTKVGRLLRPGDSRNSGWHGAPPLDAYFDFSYDAALRSLDESLERLGLDRIDIALVHDPDLHYENARDGAFPALRRLRDEGVLRAIGVGMNQTAMLCRFARETDPDCFLVAGRYTVLDRSGEKELFPLCLERGIAVIAGGVFNSGVLAGGDTFNYETASPEIVSQVESLRQACAVFDVPLPAAAVQFPLRHPAVATVLVGCRSPEEVEEDVRLASLVVPEPLWERVA
jgi:D-threo-aldose 1-dehydrogenase